MKKRILDGESRRVSRAIRKWEKRKAYSEDVRSTDELARSIGVRTGELVDYCHGTYGCSPMKWRKKLRIWHAISIIAKFPRLPDSTVGVMVGIRDKSNFRKQFIEETGISPVELKKRRRESTWRRFIKRPF